MQVASEYKKVTSIRLNNPIKYSASCWNYSDNKKHRAKKNNDDRREENIKKYTKDHKQGCSHDNKNSKQTQKSHRNARSIPFSLPISIYG